MTQPMSPQETAAELDLDAIEARATAATEGPWTTGADKAWSDALPPWALVISANYPLIELQEGVVGVADAEFVAAARQDVPALIAEVRRLRAQLADARGRACDALCRDVARDRDRLATKLGQAYAKLAQWRATFGESALRSAQHVRAERERLRADLARAQELIAELRDVAERADRAFARHDTGGGETPPDPGSVPRAQGVAADRPEIAVDGTTGVAGTSGKGADLNGAQNATQAAGVWEDRSPRCAHCGCPRTHHDRADGGCNGDFLTCTCRAYVPVVRVEG